MHLYSPVGKNVLARRTFRLLLLTLPVAAFAMLAGCGAASDDNDPYAVPGFPITASPTPGVSPTPVASPTPHPSPSPSASPVAPTQVVSGTLRIEDSSGDVIVTPFTPTSGSADVPTGIAGVLNPAALTFSTSEPFTDAAGTAVSKRTVVIGLPKLTREGEVVRLEDDAPRPYVKYDETLSQNGSGSYVNHYETPEDKYSGSLTLVSIKDDVFTIAVDAALTPTNGSSGNFHLRGTISIYAPDLVYKPLTQ